MQVIHANWSRGSLLLWGESAEACGEHRRAVNDEPERPPVAPDSESATIAHPFALDADNLWSTLLEAGLVTAEWRDDADTLTVLLPGDRLGPWPSERLEGSLGLPETLDEPTPVTCHVPAVRLKPDRLLDALQRFAAHDRANGVRMSHSIRYWGAVADMVLDLLTDQRFIPTIFQAQGETLQAAWHPWLHDDDARRRVGMLLSAMPPVIRAVRDGSDGVPWLILEESLRTMIDVAVRAALRAEDYVEAIEDRDPAADDHVAWLSGLLDREAQVPTSNGDGFALVRGVRGWINTLDERGQDLPLHLCFRLEEPADPDVDPTRAEWTLSFHLQGSDDEDLVIPAADLWSQHGASRQVASLDIERPQELLLAELGRAARIYPAIEAALTETNPAQLILSTKQAYDFLSEFIPLLEESGFGVWAPSWWKDPAAQVGARLFIDAPTLEGLTESGGLNEASQLLGLESLVRYEWRIAIGEQPLSLEEFQSLTKHRTPLVRLGDRWVEVDSEQFANAAAIVEESAGGELTLLEAIRLAHGASDQNVGMRVSGMDATGWVADLLGASDESWRLPEIKQPENFIGELRPYQATGLSWLSFLDRFGLGACLADDMGLGKTIQMIAMLLEERLHPGNNPPPGPTLLVVPTSLLANWSREFDKFAPSLRWHINHGPERPLDEEFVALSRERDVMMTTYGLVSRDLETLQQVSWHRVVLDEAQYIKNPPTKQTVAIRALNARRRVALTGTPVENRLAELWSIMEFLNPGYLGTNSDFKKRFALPIERHRDAQRADQLRRLVQPFILRRLKTDPTVISDLPDCFETKEYATLSHEQAALYERTVNTMLGRVEDSDGIQRRGVVLAGLVRLKQICNHPSLLDEGDARDGVSAASVSPTRELIARSGKCTRIISMLEEVVATKERALVFTQFRKMGHLLARIIQQELDCGVLFLHGGTPVAKRQQLIDKFHDPNEDASVFVLSLRAGGVGLNLTAANHVFHFDRWWNPAVENQATDRAFRIGQERTVHVHKFVCTGTLEERIDQMIEQKTKLAENIIGSGEDWLTDLDAGKLRDILTLRTSAREVDA